MSSAGPAAIVVPCASRKRVTPHASARALSLSRSSQSALEDAWIERLSGLPHQMPAKQLYMGRGFALGASAATSSGARLYVISAGLGLVDADRSVPSYGVTVGPHGADAIRARSIDAFDPQSWWTAVRSSAFSIDWTEAFSGEGPVLIALTRAYAEMILGDLIALPDAHKERLRLFGLALPAILPSDLAQSVMPYDERLDRILRGTRTDFAQRALSHFAEKVQCGDRRDDRERVLSILRRHRHPDRIDRPRMTDADIVAAISKHLRTEKGIGRILRRLRDVDGVACEQRRFTRLYHQAAALQGLST
ncbi:hypothetical protein [Sphingomonas faeni]|uniref:hypothetical protein n=1 Tax=Sphingomonas faeni TaxID=185950 RepID=UPI0033512240